MRLAVASLVVSLLLSGCALTPTAGPLPDSGVSIRGVVHGGQQGIVGSHVYLLAANTTGYGGPGLTASAQNASVSLLNAASTGQSDSIGAYVLTDSGGNFNISGDYSCTPNTQVYLYALGGNPGAVPNSSIGLMAILGNCPSGGNFATATPFVTINEVSTVAAAYSFAGFATDATHVSSSGTPLAQRGVANAFATAANLVDLATGTAFSGYPYYPYTGPNQSMVYSLANILSSCVNSAGAVTGPANPTACYTLFTSATSDGTPSGTQPPDTATAAINIAHNPGANVGTLYNLAPPEAPFGQGLGTQPNDFTVKIGWNNLFGYAAFTNPVVDALGNIWMIETGPAVSGPSVTELLSTGAVAPGAPFSPGDLNNGISGIAVDQAGNVWVADGANGNYVAELNSSGVPYPGSPFATGIPPDGGTPGIAIDGSGNPWLTSPSGVAKLSSGSGAVLPGFPVNDYPSSWPVGIAVDAYGNVWALDSYDANLSKYSNGGTTASGSPFVGGGIPYQGCYYPTGIAIDASNSVWVDTCGAGIAKFSNDGTPAPGSPFTAGSDGTGWIAIDGAGNVWSSERDGDGGLYKMSNGGVGAAGSPFYGSYDYGDTPLAIDGSGNVWLGDTEVVGAAVPVVTPLAAGVANNTLGTRP